MHEPARTLDVLIDQLRWKRPELVAHFYGRLFGRAPELEDLFGGSDQFELNRKFAGALLVIVRAGREPGGVEAHLVDLARDHQHRGVITAERLELFGECMARSIRHYAGEAWGEDIERQWQAAFSAAASLFLATPQPLAAPSENVGTDAHREPLRG